jgi:amino acid transporter
MTKKIRYFGLILAASALAFSSFAFSNAAPLFQVTDTPGPKVRAALALEAQAGNTDGVVFLGILIFVFIAVPLVLHYRGVRLQYKDR